MEHWHGLGQPSPVARLFAIHALMGLCQMDRAWARLRELVEEHPNWAAAHRAAAELFISRGWPKQARRPLQQAHLLDPEHPELARLEGLLRIKSPLAFSTDEPSPFETLMNQSQELLRTGSRVKGSALLNQLQSKYPEHPLVKQLIWAHSGDYSLDDLSLWKHYAERDHVYDGTITLTAPPPPAEPQEQIRTISDSAYNNRHITGLFLHATDMDTEEAYPIDESTDSIELADLEHLQSNGDVDFVRIGETIEVDTQIRRVFSKEKATGNQSHHLHSNLPERVEGFDLHTFRREMGMPSESDSDYDPDPMESEDADRIVLVQPKSHTQRLHEDPTSEWLTPDPTTADKSEDLLLLGTHEPPTPSVARSSSKTPESGIRWRSVLPWFMTIAILLGLGILSGIFILI